jgi:hypothetical protein
MRVLVLALLFFMGIPCVSANQQSGAISQIKIPPSCLTDGVRAKEVILAGTITEVRPGADNAPLGSVASASRATISVDRYIQGPRFANDSITLLVDWTDGHSKPWNLRKPLWYDVKVKPGEKLLLTVNTVEQTSDSNPSWLWTRCVFELDDNSSSVPTLEKMAFLVSSEGSTEVQTPQRLQALEAVTTASDSYTAETGKANSAIRSFMTERIGDSDPKVSRAGIRWVYLQVRSDGAKRPDSAWFWIGNRERVLKQLRSEASDGPVRREAVRLLEFFGCQSAPHSAPCRLR